MQRTNTMDSDGEAKSDTHEEKERKKLELKNMK